MADSSKALLPVYLFIGDDNLKRNALLSRMKQRVGEMGDITLNLNTFEGPEVEPPDAVVAACNTMPFLSERRLVVVKDIGDAKKAVLDSLADYVVSPMETTVLVLTGDKLNKSSRLYKNAVKQFPKSFIACDSKKKRNEVIDLVCKMMGALGMEFDPAAAAHLVDLVGTSTVTLDAEVRKVRDYVAAQGRGFVDVRDVDAVVVKATEPKPWEIVDAMSKRDARACLCLLSESKDSTPYSVMSLCERRIRELIVVKSLRTRPGGGSIKDAELIEALDQAAECEFRMKTGTEPDIALSLWLVGVCTGRYPF